MNGSGASMSRHACHVSILADGRWSREHAPGDSCRAASVDRTDMIPHEELFVRHRQAVQGLTPDNKFLIIHIRR